MLHLLHLFLKKVLPHKKNKKKTNKKVKRKREKKYTWDLNHKSKISYIDLNQSNWVQQVERSDCSKVEALEGSCKSTASLERKPYRIHRIEQKHDGVKAAIYFADDVMQRKMKHPLYSFGSYSCTKHMLCLKGKKKNLKRGKRIFEK